MAKEKITLTLDAGRLAELRSQVGSRSVSAAVDAALATYLDRLRHGAAVLAEVVQERFIVRWTPGWEYGPGNYSDDSPPVRSWPWTRS